MAVRCRSLSSDFKRCLTGILLCAFVVCASNVEAQTESRLTAIDEVAHPLSLIRVPVEVGSVVSNDHQKLTFVLDTGVAISMIDPSCEKYCVGEPVEGSMMAGHDRVPLKAYPWINARLRSGEAVGGCGLLQMNPFEEHFGYRCSGILGASVLEESGFGYVAAGGYFYIGISPLRLFERRYDLRKIDGQYYTSDIQLCELTSSFLIDSGMNHPLSLRSEVFVQLVERNLISQVSTGSSLTGAGVKTRRVGRLSSVQVWGTQFDDVIVMESEGDKVGLAMLMKFDFRMNCRDREIEVSENSDTKLAFLGGGRHITLIRRHGLMQIAEVFEGTDIDLRAGDTIIAVDGRNVTDAWDEVVKVRALLRDPATKSVEFEIERDGKRLHRTLKIK